MSSASAHIQALGSRRERVHADVCVIGAGFAGLVAAARIAAAIEGRVVVLESGGDPDDPAVVELDKLDDPSGTYGGTLRRRGLGGTSALWDGKLLPLSPHDMAPRPAVDLPGWPIEPATLARYVPEIEALMGVTTDGYAGPAVPRSTERMPNTDAITWRWPKHPARHRYRIDRVLRRRLSALRNLSIWTQATVTGLAAKDGQLAQVTAVNHHGGELVVEATHYVLAAGTLESTRLLLLADRQNNGVISTTTDALGRYFNDHFGIKVATVRPRDPLAVNRGWADRFAIGTKRHLQAELSEKTQRESAIGSAYFDIDPEFPTDSALTAARTVALGLRRGSARGLARPARQAVAGLPLIARALGWRIGRGQQLWPPDVSLRVKLWIEQLPRYSNRLLLGSRLDSLGQPVLRADLRLTDEDERTAQMTVAVLDAFWAGNMGHLGELDWTVPSGRLVDAAGEQAHPAGATRMGTDPARSVVDAALRIHALPNVQVASASVFPSSGSANPTMTIIQLAMLAADDVIRRHRTGTA